MENELHVILIKQTTHQDSFQKSGLRRILLFDKSCLRRILLLLHHAVVNLILSVLFCLPIHWCVNDCNSNTQWLQRLNWYKTTVKNVSNSQIKPREIQIAQRQFNSRTIYKEQHTSTQVTWISQLLDKSLFTWQYAVTTPLTRSERILMYLNTSFCREFFN